MRLSLQRLLVPGSSVVTHLGGQDLVTVQTPAPFLRESGFQCAPAVPEIPETSDPFQWSTKCPGKHL